MSVVKNRSTQKNREFWDHVEAIAAQVRARRGEMSQSLLRAVQLDNQRLLSENAALQAERDALRRENERMKALQRDTVTAAGNIRYVALQSCLRKPIPEDWRRILNLLIPFCHHPVHYAGTDTGMMTLCSICGSEEVPQMCGSAPKENPNA